MRSENETQMPDVVPAVALCVALCGIVILELAMRATLTHAPGRMRIFAIREVGWAFLPLALGMQWLLRGSGVKGLATACAVAVTAYVTIVQFRGLWVWSGTFDAYWYSKAPWIMPGLAGLTMGCAFSTKRFRPWVPKRSRLIVWPLCLIGAGLIELFGCYFFYQQIDSVYAPTRSVVLVATGIVLGAGCFHVWRSE